MDKSENNIQDPKSWVIEQLSRHSLDYDYKTDALKRDGGIFEESLAVSLLRLDAREQDVEDLRSYIRDALAVYKHERAQVELKKLTQNLTVRPSNSDQVAIWVKAVCGTVSQLDVAVMKHFIWQVKRKLAGLSVDHHIMPVIFGKSGAGKSVAVLRLVDPLKSVTLQADMSIFEDAFSRRAFSRNYIVFFDELHGSEDADVNAMKQIITAPVIEWRAMRSERVMSAPQNSTFIGCSNDPVRDRIKDPTSSRRFWQITCADKVDWEAINSIDYLELWRSVDETSPAPVLDLIDEIRKIQEIEIRAKDITEQWIEEMCEVVSFDESSLTTSELYDSFREFCLWQKQKSFPQFQKFARDVKRILGTYHTEALSKKTNRGTTWAIRLRSHEAVSVAVDIRDRFDVQLAFDFKVA